MSKHHSQKMRYALAGAMLIASATASAQNVSGTVKDANGEPVIGATVMETGTQNGTVTDMDGKFSLKLQKAGSLNVSYIGMKSQTIKTNGKSAFDVVMQDDAALLEDVVVVGYGTQKKSDLTGAISSVDTEKLNAKGSTSVMGNLQGAVAGVNITQSSGRADGGFNIEVRGQSTMGSNNTPLFVVDGVICDGIDWLNPQDIERIDILKDASSTAIYGSRATNGVVIVSTKSAKTQGSKATSPTVTYDGYYGFSKTVRTPEFMDAEQFKQYRFFRYENAVNEVATDGGYKFSDSGVAYGAQNKWGITEGNWQTAMLAQASGADGKLTNESTLLGQVLANGTATDWKGLVTRSTAAQQNHYISVSGNSTSTNYHFGFGYQSEEGTFINDGMKRFNLKGTVDSKISKYLNAGISFNGAYKINETTNTKGIENAFLMNPFIKAYDSNGGLILKPGMSDQLGTGTGGSQFTSTMNPLLDFENSNYQTKTYNVLANIYLEVLPGVKGLSLKSTFSPNYIHTRAGEFDGSKTTQQNLGTNHAAVTNTDKFSWTWDNMINYNLRTEKHNLGAMFLFSSSAFRQEKYTQEARDVVEETLWYNLGQMNSASPTYSSGSAYTEWSMMSYALRLNYSYLDRYYFTGTVRWDGSSRFADGNRWGSFPSLALAWRISEEPWMKKTQKWLSNLKLRATFGVTGNNYTEGTNYATSVTATHGTSVGNYYYYGFSDGTGNNVYYPGSIVNKNLTWEKTTEFNVGVDFGFLGGRINGSIDWYNKTSKDLLMRRQLAYEAGGVKVTDNVGRVRNTGIEVTLNTVNIQTKNWRWTTSFNFAHNSNKILEVNGGTEDDIANSLFVGESIFALYNYKWTGIVSDLPISLNEQQYALYKEKGGSKEQGDILSRDYYYQVYGWGEGMPVIEDLNNDGTIDANDKTIIGKSNPSWTGSFTSNLQYKNWDFSISLYTKQNYQVYDAFYGKYTTYGDRGMSHIAMDYYIPDGTLLSCDYDANGNVINAVYQQGTHYGTYPLPTNQSASNAGAGTYWAGSNAKTGSTAAVSTSNMQSINQKGNPYQVVDASYWKIQNISLGYTFPKKWLEKTKVIKACRLYVNVTNPFCWSKGYKGFDPELSTSSLSDQAPSKVTFQFGGSLKF